MSWTDLLRSRYVRALEAELATLRQRHIDELERLKTVHAEELNRCIVEANRGWAEADRLRQYLIPGLPVANRVTEPPNNNPPEATQVESGTPYQRLLKKRLKEIAEANAAAEAAQRAALQAKTETPVTPAQEN